MLGNRGQPLVEMTLQAVVIGVEQEVAAPEVWSPMSHDPDQPDQLPLVRH